MGEFRLDLLGPFQFERLCQTLLVAAHGVAVEAWGGNADWGRDAYAVGELPFPHPDRIEPGPFVFQCKFVESAAQLGTKGADRLSRALRLERDRIRHRAFAEADPTPRHYAIMTNVAVPPAKRERVKDVVAAALPGATHHLLDEAQIETMLLAKPAIAAAFPQLLTVRQLDQLLAGVVNRDLASRSKAMLEAAQELAEVFVSTEAHRHALETLARHAFLVLTGAPEVGKTSIAKMVAHARAAAGWEVIDCRSPRDFDRAFQVERAQLFVADDALGSTEYRPAAAQEWAAVLPLVLRRLDDRHWLVWTSRSAPLREGLRRLHLDDVAESFPQPGEVLVTTDALSLEERALMLHQHARHAKLSAAARRVVQHVALPLLTHEHFTPLRVARFVAQRVEQLAASVSDSATLAAAVEEEMSGATKVMRRSFATLAPEQRRLLISMLDVDPSDLTLEAIGEAYERHRDDGDRGSAQELLAGLEEHVVRQAFA